MGFKANLTALQKKLTQDLVAGNPTSVILLGCIYLVITLWILVASRICLPEFHSKWPFSRNLEKKEFMEFNTFDFHPHVAAGVTAARYLTPNADPGTGNPAGHARARHRGPGPNRHREDRGLCAAHPPSPDARRAPAASGLWLLPPLANWPSKPTRPLAPWDAGPDSRALLFMAELVSILRRIS